MTEARQTKPRALSPRNAKAAILGAVALVLTVSSYLYGGSRRTFWRDMFKYDGIIEDAQGVRRQALVPLRNVWILVDQESGDDDAMTKGNFMDCRVNAREKRVHPENAQEDTQYMVTELLLSCEDGARVFVVKGLAGAN